jgi:transposase-like protein
MKDLSIEERAIKIAEYIIDSKDTVRGAAKKFGISKSTVHTVVTLKNGRKNGQVIPESIEIWKYKSKIKSLEKENSRLNRIIDKFYETVEKFIEWICHKFGIGESKELVRDFEKDTNTLIDPEKQLKKEEREKEWDLEL